MIDSPYAKIRNDFIRRLNEKVELELNRLYKNCLAPGFNQNDSIEAIKILRKSESVIEAIFKNYIEEEARAR